MTYLEALLTETRKLIDTPEKWCKYTYAVYDGMAVSPLGGHAHSGKCSFCLTGALFHATDKVLNRSPDWHSLYEVFRKPVSKRMDAKARSFPASLVAFNDLPSTTHEDILALLDETLAALKRNNDEES